MNAYQQFGTPPLIVNVIAYLFSIKKRASIHRSLKYL